MCNIFLKFFLWIFKCINIVFNLCIIVIVWKYLFEVKVSFFKKNKYILYFYLKLIINNVLVVILY